MSIVSKQLFAALLGAAILSSCSRPVAYFQRTPTERFTSPKTETVAVAAEPTTPPATTELTSEGTPTTPTEQMAGARHTMSQIDAYVRNDSKLASNKKLTKRMARVNQLLTTAEQKSTLAMPTASTKKMTLMERTVLRKMDKKIRNHVAPDQTNALNKNTRNGIIIGGVGLILALLFTGAIGVIGVVLLIVGVILLLLGVLDS